MAFDLLTIRNLHILYLKSEQFLVFIVWFLITQIFCKSSHVASHCTIWVNKIPSIVYWLTQSKPEYKGSNKPTKPASKIISQDWSKLLENLKIVLKDIQDKNSVQFCQFPFWWIYYYCSNKSTGKETCKTHLCAV